MGNVSGSPSTFKNKIGTRRKSSKLRSSLTSTKNGQSHEKFSDQELVLIKAMFNDLAKRSPNDTISKDTFIEYFNLPGILSDRLFDVFDYKQTKNIDFEEFVSGLARV